MSFDRITHAFAGNPLDRAAVLRTDANEVARLLASPDAGIVAFADDRPLIAISDDGSRMDIVWLKPADILTHRADGSPLILLGVTQDAEQGTGRTAGKTGAPRFACRIDVGADGEPDPAFSSLGKFIDLRSLAVQGLLARDQLGILTQARSLGAWHTRHTFCANCGAPTQAADAGYKRICGGCGAEHFPRTDPVAIMVVHHGTDCLLGRQAHFPEGSYSALAGFIEAGESIEEAARREIFEEAGVLVGKIAYHSSQPWPFPSNLMIGLIGEALDKTLDVDFEEMEDARWFPREEVISMIHRTHEGGLFTPPDISIAHQMIKSFYGQD